MPDGIASMPVPPLLCAFSSTLFTSFSQSLSCLIPTLTIVFCVAGVAQAKTWTTSASGLQNSINKARDGDIIRVTGSSTKSQILVKKRLTIEGKGNHTLSGMMTVRASGAVVRNLTFRNVSYGSRSASISVRGAHKVRVEHNDIAGSRGMGIFVARSNDVEVTDNKIRSVRCMKGSSGYTTAQGVKVGQGSKRIVVMNNTVEGLQGCRTTAAFSVIRAARMACSKEIG